MKKLLLAWSLMTALSTLFAEIIKLPAPFPAGEITAFEIVRAPLNFVSLEKAAEKSAQEAEPAIDEILEERQPEIGMLYVIFTVKLEKGRTLSKFDYLLENNNGSITPCLDMGRANETYFDFRLKVQEGPEIFKLVFACPQDSYEVRLKSAFMNIPLPPTGDFVVNERPAPPPPPPAPAAPAADAKPAEGEKPAENAAPAVPAADAKPADATK